MLYILHGTDRRAVRVEASAIAHTHPRERIRITDTHTAQDLSSILQGSGMFAGVRTLVLEYILSNEELAAMVESSLAVMQESSDTYIILEETLSAEQKKRFSPFATLVERNLPKRSASPTTIFALSNALKRRDKKNLWIAYRHEVEIGSAPEAIHGVLFWAAKDMLQKQKIAPEGIALIRALVTLPHEARRNGEDLGYALERFILTFA